MSTWSSTGRQSAFKWHHSNEHFLRVLPTRWRQKPTGIDTERNYVTVSLCIVLLLWATLPCLGDDWTARRNWPIPSGCWEHAGRPADVYAATSRYLQQPTSLHLYCCIVVVQPAPAMTPGFPRSHLRLAALDTSVRIRATAARRRRRINWVSVYRTGWLAHRTPGRPVAARTIRRVPVRQPNDRKNTGATRARRRWSR